MKAAVVLSGCGYLDGAEIRESVLTLLYLDQHDISYDCFAPDIPQADVVNHLDGQAREEFRGVLTESARIARGQIDDLAALQPENYDMLLLPGGFGAAKNWSDFAVKGADCSVLPELDRVVHGFYDQGKPIGAICIAPAILGACLKGEGLTLTIGEDKDVASAIEGFGHKHVVKASNEAAIDEKHRVVTCSAYMREDRVSAIAEGIEQLVDAVIRLSKQTPLSKVS